MQTNDRNCYNCFWGGDGSEIEDFGHCWLHNGEADFTQPPKCEGCGEWRSNIDKMCAGAQLYIRDNTTGRVHKYGTNQHDALILQEDGSLHYENLQNSCGTMFPDEGYSFVYADGTSPKESDCIEQTVYSYLDIGGKAVSKGEEPPTDPEAMRKAEEFWKEVLGDDAG